MPTLSFNSLFLNNSLSCCRFVYFLFFVLVSTSLSSQRQDTAQLRNSIEQTKNVEKKLNSMLLLANAFSGFGEQQKVYVISLQAYLLADSLSDTKNKLEASYFLTRSLYVLQDYDQSSFFGLTGLELANLLGDKEKQASLYNILGLAERRIDNCRVAIEYHLKAINLNKELKDSIQLAKNYINISNCYTDEGLYTKSLEVLGSAYPLKLMEKDTIGMANIYFSMGNAYDGLNEYKKAFEHYLRALEHYELIEHETMIANTNNNIGLVYYKMGNLTKALQFYEKAKVIALANEDLELQAKIYQNMANIQSEQKDYTTSIENQKNALALFQQLGSTNSQKNVILNIGIDFMESGKYDSSAVYLNRVLEMSKETNDTIDLANITTELGRLELYQKNYLPAQIFLQEGLHLANSTQDLLLKSYANKNLYELYELMENPNAALSHYKMYHDQLDSLEVIEQEQAITKIKSQFDFEKQATEIELLNKENLLNEVEAKQALNQRNFSFVLLGFMIVIAGFIYFQFRYSRQKNKIITKEKERSDSLLRNILPAETAEELKNKGAVQAKRFNLTTVMFTDFVNFTNYSEGVNPEEIVKSIDHYFRAFDQIIAKYGIEKIKTIGDAYMCVGGLPQPNLTNPLDIVHASKEMLEFVVNTAKSPPDGIHPFNIRIGINSGPVVAGVVGITKFQYDIWGSTVNLASRMESACEVNRINISETTYHMIKEELECEERGEIEIKNQGKLKMYYLKQ
jgi:class 3 adenylate cyclase